MRLQACGAGQAADSPGERAAPPRVATLSRMEQSKIAFAVGAAAGATALLLVQRWQRRRPRPATAGCVEGNPGFRVEGEEREVYRRFLAVYDRKVVYPDGRSADFDIVGHPRSYHFVCVFVFHTADRSVTLLREFAQAGLPEAALVFGLACGGYDPRKHRSAQHAAESELSEEARLEGGRWTRLLPTDHPGVLEAKWCRNRFTPFLCVDPQPAAQPLPRDAEEHVEVLRMPTEQLRPNPDPDPNPNPNPNPNPDPDPDPSPSPNPNQVLRMPTERLRATMCGGEMLTPSVLTCVMALAHLERHGLI